MILQDGRLADKVRKIALLYSVPTADALEFVVRHGLTYIEKIVAESPYVVRDGRLTVIKKEKTK